jgi:hypothetical protein
MKKHSGHGGSHYDSMAEAAASYRLAELGFSRNGDKFNQIFTDAEGTEFHACPDFYHADHDIYLEFKASKLNSLKTKAGSVKRLNSMAVFRRGAPLPSDNLNYGWNHSKHKQAIIQKALTPARLIICFQDTHTPTYDEAIEYMKAGIRFCTVGTLRTYITALRLRKRGVPVGFRHSYSLEDDNGEVLPPSITYH